MSIRNILLWLLFFSVWRPTQAAITAGESIASILLFGAIQPRELTITLKQTSPGMIVLQNESGLQSRHTLSTNDKAHIRLQDGELAVFLSGQARLVSSQVSLSCPEMCSIQLEAQPHLKRLYRGNLQLQPADNTIIVILRTSESQLIASIVMSEMRGFEDQTEALKAFAVLARTFVRSGVRHTDSGADLCDTTHCQVYQAISPSPAVTQAVQQTDEMLLMYRQKLFRPYYSRACGGRTEAYSAVWSKPSPDYPYASISCPCAATKSQWTCTMSRRQVAELTEIDNPVVTSSKNGVVISNSDRRITMSREQFRILTGRVVGWNKIKSNQFSIEPMSDHDFRIRGSGMGHSVGFCQTGAAILSSSGVSFTNILRHYFPNTELRN